MIQQITDMIIRPLKPKYDPKVDLGPNLFSIDNQHVGTRVDFEFTNRRGYILKCSMFHQEMEKNRKYPLVLFCHGNTGNRTRSFGAVYSMLRSKVNVVTFDFAGCGLSEGKTISLGYYEQDDIADVLDHVIDNFRFIDTNRIGIWGRCMGAVSAILYTAKSDNIALLILDSPFPDFPSLIRNYIQRAKIIPKWAEEYIYENLRTQILEQASFDFEEVSAISKVSECRMPAFFVHGCNDGIIPINLFKKVYEAYPGAKDYIELKTSHNDPRPDFIYEAITHFVRSKFFSSKIYGGNFGPAPKKSDPGISPVILRGNSLFLMSLDSIKFLENDSEAKDEFENPVEQALENIGPSKDLEIMALSQNKKDILTRQVLKSAVIRGQYDETKTSEKETFVVNRHSLNSSFDSKKPKGRWQSPIKVIGTIKELPHEEEEGNISDELLETGQVSNKVALERIFISSATKNTFCSYREKKKRIMSVL